VHVPSAVTYDVGFTSLWDPNGDSFNKQWEKYADVTHGLFADDYMFDYPLTV